MDVTERFWTIAGSGGFLIVVGIIAEQRLLLVPAAGLGAWLLGSAVTASHAFVETSKHTQIDCVAATTDAVVETETTVTLHVTRPADSATVPLTVDVTTPPGVRITSGESTVNLTAGETAATATMTVTFSVAGHFEFPPATLSMTDSLGLYRAQRPEMVTPDMTVRPHSPDLHIGRGGEGVQSAYGQHRADRPGPGVTTRELREYLPGDDFQQIDWNATARLAETYVRETEGETDRETLLIVDHRARMALGNAGERILDYAREVAIGITQAAADSGDPLGLWTVGNNGITETVQPNTTPQTYARVTSALYAVEPTNDTTVPGSRSPREAQQLTDRLAATDGPFADVLAPYLKDQTAYVRRFREDPLVNTVRQVQNNVSRGGLLVIVTSDADPAKLRETVKIAIQSGSQLLVFVAPNCLFESTDPTALDETYAAYRAFEELRRNLENHPRVTVFEMAPETRIRTVLAHRQAQTPSVR